MLPLGLGFAPCLVLGTSGFGRQQAISQQAMRQQAMQQAQAVRLRLAWGWWDSTQVLILISGWVLMESCSGIAIDARSGFAILAVKINSQRQVGEEEDIAVNMSFGTATVRSMAAIRGTAADGRWSASSCPCGASARALRISPDFHVFQVIVVPSMLCHRCCTVLGAAVQREKNPNPVIPLLPPLPSP